MEAREAALAAALDQIDMAFGSKPPSAEFRFRRAKREMERLLAIRGRLETLAMLNEAKEPSDRGWTEIDPLAAYVAAWYLRKEADSDHVISMDGKASDALEEVAGHIEDGEILACPEEMLRDMDGRIAFWRSEIETCDSDGTRRAETA